MDILFLLPLILITLVSIVIGLFLLINPVLAIKIQIGFYKKINWRIEPISMAREVRNTRLMGLLLIIAALLAVFKLFR